MTQSQPEGEDTFVGTPDEENPTAKTAGEQPHEDPWKYADLDAPHSPPSNDDSEES